MEVALIWGATLLTTTAILAVVGLKAWRGWLDLRRLEIGTKQPAVDEEPPTGIRIELAAVKERLRKLEAIAQGVDL